MTFNKNRLKCNCCGEAIQKVDERNHQDYLKIDKTWGYFSDKDLTHHQIIICEKCYDEWTKQFKISVEDEEIIDLFGNMVEDNAHY